jgi:hypothetical protein
LSINHDVTVPVTQTKLPSFKDPNFPSSLDMRNVDRVSEPIFKKGVIAAARRLPTLIDSSDWQWLYTHNGDFQKFCHPEATHFKEFRKRKHRSNKTIEELKKLLETKQLLLFCPPLHTFQPRNPT